MSSTHSHDTWKELAHRESDGLAISLFWNEATDRVSLAIVDQMFGAEHHVDVPRACALDAFYHPFAYESGRGCRLGDAMRESLALQPQN